MPVLVINGGSSAGGASGRARSTSGEYVEPGEVYVRRVRAVSVERDALALRTRLAGALAQASLHPRGMPRSAVLCVRRLRAPRASAHSLDRHNSHAQRAWAEACAESIERLLSSAARPARGFVPAAAESVVFADRAELLACLAGDWCAGQVRAHWWWRALFKQDGADSALDAAWGAQPEYVPGALEHLARQNLVRDFARALPADSARTLLDGVVRRFALGALAVELAAARRDSEPSGRTPDDAAAAAAFGGESHTATAYFAPWRHVAPEAEAAPLGPEAACLLGVGLTLQRAPAAARAPSFARAVRGWLRARDVTARALKDARADSVERPRESDPEPEATALDARPSSAETRTETHARAEAGARAERDARGEAAETRRAPAAGDEVETVERVSDALPEDARRTHAPVVEAKAFEVSGEPDAQAEPSARGSEASARETESHAHGPQAAPDVRRMPPEAAAEIEVAAESSAEHAAEVEEVAAFVEASCASPLEAQMVTRFGGVFFLVNLGLFLELYGDFSAPLKPGLALSVWDFCALLGARMCGRALRKDPVWALLAQLAGRDEKTEPGAGFEPPDEWRVPRAWLARLPRAGAWRWTSARGRLRVVHPSGLVVFDVARDRRPAASQLADESEAYADLYTATPERDERDERAARSLSRTPLSRWLACMSAYARARLCYALGCDARSLPSLLFAHTARVSVTTTHVDVVMALSELPVEVRVAGLDRDPGWVPAAGRYVAFHFD